MVEILAGAFVVLVFLVGLALIYVMLLGFAMSNDWGVVPLYLFIGSLGAFVFFCIAKFAGSLLTTLAG